MNDYNPQKIEEKWQKKWEEAKIFEVQKDLKKKKYYILEMYPYPSGKLHIGHLRNYTVGDAFTRFKRMCGFQILYPMGYDSFGLPAENAAIDEGVNPEEWTNLNIDIVRNQQKRIGLSYDWTREIHSHDPNYFKWDQWFFLKMFEKDLAYREDSYINWCPQCATVLANEQVQGGHCWRCNSEVEQKFLTQWFLKIRSYAEELLNGLNNVDWPEKVKVMQRNWIGRSEGSIIKFPIVGEERTIDIFTTRADTLYGVTFMVFAPEHPWVREWVKGTEYEKDFEIFYTDVMKQNKFERMDVKVDKKGMFIGKYAINPMTKEKVPIYIGNFIIYEYGAGAVMAVPAHDQRDFEFAKEYNITIRVVIQPPDYELNEDKMTRAYMADGILVNSEEFDGMDNRTAINAITKKLEKIGMGKATVNYKLRDWLISRQRYWGCPIPIIYCDDCGVVHVPYENLPLELPKDVKFTGKGNPLETSESFINCQCPKCGKPGRRETDTMDTFVDSSWYFFRFCDPHVKDLPYRKEIVDYWGNVDQYIGGIEHAIMHLLYARFFTKVARDLGLHSHDEPFQRLFTHGMINKAHPYCSKCNTFAMKAEMHDERCKRCGTKYILKSAKMSKSLGNTVDPIGIMNEYGADATRFFILFGASPEKGMEWSDQGVGFAYKFVSGLWNLFTESLEKIRKKRNINDDLIEFQLNKTIKFVTEHMNNLAIRDAINEIVQFIPNLKEYKKNGVIEHLYKECQEKLLLLLHPFIPHITEELWEMLGHKDFLSISTWPSYNKNLLTDENDFKWNLMNNTIDDVKNIIQILKDQKISLIKIVIATEWKYKLFSILIPLIEKSKDQGEIMKSVMQDAELKKFGKQINQITNNILQNLRTYSKIVLTSKDEMDFFNEIKPTFQDKFKCNIEIFLEDQIDHKKAKQALPGKPVLILE